MTPTTPPKTALITGVTGQDGAYLAEDAQAQSSSLIRVRSHDARRLVATYRPKHGTHD